MQQPGGPMACAYGLRLHSLGAPVSGPYVAAAAPSLPPTRLRTPPSPPPAAAYVTIS
jgi:hypothetical protein